MAGAPNRYCPYNWVASRPGASRGGAAFSGEWTSEGTLVLTLLAKWQCFTAGERGASLVEYAFLAMLIALAALVAVEFLGGEVEANFTDYSTELGNARP